MDVLMNIKFGVIFKFLRIRKYKNLTKILVFSKTWDVCQIYLSTNDKLYRQTIVPIFFFEVFTKIYLWPNHISFISGFTCIYKPKLYVSESQWSQIYLNKLALSYLFTFQTRFKLADKILCGHWFSLQ